MGEINSSIKRGTAELLCGVMMYIISAAMLIYSVYLCFSPDIWYDELFSMEFARRPISEMIRLTAADVHPPLYYIIVHCAILIGRAVSGSLSLPATMMGSMGAEIVCAKLASVVPLIIIFIYAVTAVRRKYGPIAGGLFSMAVIAMPNMAEYSVEIRMYSWVILFITAMCIHADEFIVRDDQKVIRGLKWGKVFPIFIYGLMACYTQYYAAVAAFAIYLFLVIHSVRKNIWQLGILLISANLTVVLYIPWLSVVFSQVGTVSQNYWILPLTWRSIGGVIKYLILPAFTIQWIAYAFAAVLFVLSFITVISNLKNEYMWLCFMPIIGIVIFGFAVSFIVRPIFVYRYMLPGMGAFWYGVIVALTDRRGYLLSENNGLLKSGGSDEMSNHLMSGNPTVEIEGIQKNRYNGDMVIRVIGIALVVVMAVISVRDFWAFRGNELYKRVNMQKTSELLGSICSGSEMLLPDSSDDEPDHTESEVQADSESVIDSEKSSDLEIYADAPVIISNFDHVDALLAFYLNESDNVGYDGTVQVPLYAAEPEALIQKLVPGVGTINTGGDVRKLLENGRTVLFLGSFNSREDIIKDWEDTEGIKSTNNGSFLMERYWFDVFELSLE